MEKLQELMAKVRSFATMASNDKQAIDIAEQNKQINKADAEALRQKLNNNGNWEVFDGFTHSQAEKYDIKKAPDYKFEADVNKNLAKKQVKPETESESNVVGNVAACTTVGAIAGSYVGGIGAIPGGLIGFAVGTMFNCADRFASSDHNNTQIGIQINDNATLASAVIQLTTQIAKANAQQAGYLNQLVTALNNLSANYSAEAEKNEEFRQKTVTLLQQIQEGLNSKLPESLKIYFTNVVDAVNTNGDKLDELIKLMKLLNAKADKMTAEQKVHTERIMEALKNNNFNMVGGMNAILQAVLYGNESLDKISDKVDKIIKMLDILQELMKIHGEKLCNVILKGIAKIDGDFTVVEDLIKQLIKDQEVNGDKIDNLTAVVENMGLNILTKLNRQAPDYSAQLSTITNLLMNIKPSEVDLTKLETLVGNAVTGVNNNTQLLKELKNRNDIIIDILKSFKKDVDNIGKDVGDINGWLELIYKKIPTGKTGGCKCDVNALIAKLDEILAAIKDHDVKITVEGEKCSCTCDGKPVNPANPTESVLANLQNILG